MLRLFLASAARLGALIYRTFIPVPGTGRPSVRRQLVMAGFIPLFVLIQGIHWIGLFLDEILFPGARRVTIREPLFVLGVPRSGTTHLHRVLAEDTQFTTFSTWECLFALSVTARFFWLGVGRLDRAIGRPGGRLLDWLERRAFNGLQEVHGMRLRDPEEDYFALMPVLACFILVLPFPHSDFLWRMGTFDRDMPEADRRQLMDFYRRSLQKHLYVHGQQKRLLSKNAAFAPLAGNLAAYFPDARFLICLREPAQTFPSQISSIASGIRFFDARTSAPDLSERLIRQLGFYYVNLDNALRALPDARCAWVTMHTLKTDLAAAVSSLYGQLGLTFASDFKEKLRERSRAAKAYRSSHDYRAEQFGLAPDRIDQELGALYRSLAARAVQPTGSPPSCGDLQRPSPTTETASSC